MSISQRIDDSQYFYAIGRKEGALLSLLVAVAATSRKRFPKGTLSAFQVSGKKPKEMGDREAFETFLKQEMSLITSAATGGPSIGQLIVQYNGPGDDSGQQIPIEQCFYKYIRCELAHEATFTGVKFVESELGRLSVETDSDKLILSASWLDGLAYAVCVAPENYSEFESLHIIAAQENKDLRKPTGFQVIIRLGLFPHMKEEFKNNISKDIDNNMSGKLVSKDGK